MTRSSKHTTIVPVEIGVGVWSTEILAEVRFVYQPGDPRPVSSYSISPPDPECIEDIEVIAIRDETGRLLTPPLWLRDWIVENVDQDTLCEEAADDLNDRYERAMEDRYERQREDREFARVYGGEE